LYDFQSVRDRAAWSSTKWMKYAGQDVIPLSLADMDYSTAPAIQKAVAEHVARGDFGYMSAPAGLAQMLVEDHRRRYGWEVDRDSIVWLSGVVLGLNLAVKTCCGPGEGAVVLSPIYPPFLRAPGVQGRSLMDVPMGEVKTAVIEFSIDFDALERTVTTHATREGHTGKARLLMLCHPHNPIGRLFTRTELDQLADFCERHELYVCSDELHCDLILDEQTSHIPFARVAQSCSPALLERMITLHGPGKTYNTAGLGIAWAIIPNADLRRRFQASMQKLVPDPCCLGFTALRAAFLSGEPWRKALVTQLRINRDTVSVALDRMGLPHTHPEVSFLTWIDARAIASKVGSPAAWFERYGTGLSDGADFGRPGFLRLNFAAPAALLAEALARMQAAVAAA
jgi:cysteine-S-conjugate beta-lyase